MPLYAGFDLGGTHLKYGLIDDGGRILFKARAESPGKIEELIHLLKRIWQDLKKREKQGIRAAGFGFPGIFSREEQKFFNLPIILSLTTLT